MSTTPSTHAFVSFAYDRSGNQAGIAGVWIVPDDFEPETEYATFKRDFAAKHPTKSGRLTERLRKTQARSWLRWMSARFEKVSFVHRED
jgi:hypothetical protein